MELLSLYNKNYSEITYTDGVGALAVVTPDHEPGFGILIKNTSATEPVKLIIEKGDSIQALDELEITVAAATDVIINLKETGKYKHLSGENAGKIVFNLEGNALTDVKLLAFEL